MVQAKFLPHLPAGERRAALLQARLREITILEVFEVALDQLASVVGLRAPRASRQLGKSPLNFKVEPDRKHGNLPLYNTSYTSRTQESRRTSGYWCHLRDTLYPG